MREAGATLAFLLFATPAIGAGAPDFDGGSSNGATVGIMEGLKEAAAEMKGIAAADIKGVAAAQPVFTGRATWTSNYGRGFSALEQLGVRKSAEDRAILECQRQGIVSCVAVVADITTCGSYECSATAVAKELRIPPGSVKKTVSGTARWTSNYGNGFSALEQLGVRMSAEDRAVLYCKSQGLAECAPMMSTIETCGSYSCNATAVSVGFDMPAGAGK